MSEDGLEPLRPLAELLELADQVRGPLGFVPSIVPPREAGWVPARVLLEEPLARMSELTAARWEAPVHVGAALFWKLYAYWSAVPVAIGWALNRRVPLMPIDAVALRLIESEPNVRVALRDVTVAVLPGDPCAGAPGTVVTGDLGAIIRETLIDDHHLPVIRALNDFSRVGERTLLGSTAEALAHPLTLLDGLLPRDPRTEIPELLRITGMDRLIELETDLQLRRRTCCLWITLPGRRDQACASCCAALCSAALGGGVAGGGPRWHRWTGSRWPRRWRRRRPRS